MDLKKLRYFVAVCEHGSINDAARAVYLSQPALSRQIRLLEESLGIALFHRQPRGMRPTAAGIRLQDHAHALLRTAAWVRDEVLFEDQAPAGQVAVAVPTSLRAMVLTPALEQFTSLYPQVRVRILEGTSRGMRDAVASGMADVAIASTLDDVEFLHAEPLIREGLYLIGPPGDPRLGRQRISPRSLAKLPLALTARPNSLRTIVDQEALGHGDDYEPRFEVQSLEMALALIRATGVFSVFPASGIQEALQSHRVEAIPITGLNLTWALLTSRERPLSRAAELLRGGLRQASLDAFSAGSWPGARRPETKS